jgi:small nuclear ribonucleoprotein (snRNP)-like protein
LEAAVTGFREFVAIALVECLLLVGFPQQAQAMAATERGEGFRQKVEQLGAGAEVRVTLKDQRQSLRGTVESFDDSAFRLRPGRGGEQQTVRYVDVWVLEFTKTKYHADGLSSSDPVTARRVAVELGVGSKVEVQLANNEKLEGKLGGVSDEGIILKQAKGSQIEERKIAFAEIKSIKTARSTGGSIGLTVLVGLGVLVGVVLILVYHYGMGD